MAIELPGHRWRARFRSDSPPWSAGRTCSGSGGARVEEHETARAVVFLASPGAKQVWPKSARADRRGRPRRDRRPGPRARGGQPPRRTARSTSGSPGSIARGTPMTASISSSQLSVWRFMSIVRLAFVTSVTWMPRGRRAAGAAGQVPDHPAVDRSEKEIARLRPLARAGHAVQQPPNLGPGEVGRERSPTLERNRSWPPLRASSATEIVCSRVLPDDGVVDGPTGSAVPHHRGLALVRDADRGKVAAG